ncbi:MAG: UDP-N-acetylmuramate dehydrogenase [Hydrotalea sp.]|nr:UDP-N-acetylmuramate dehydrogenase [Hydrotalea sp.]
MHCPPNWKNYYKKMVAQKLSSLLHELGAELGEKLLFDEPLARHSWFGVGGKADIFFTPHDIAQLQYFLKNLPRDIPITTIGGASNLLVRDNGVRGAVIKLGKGFNSMTHHNGMITAGAAVRDATLAQFALQEHVAGFEFYIGIPGTVGGAVIMNAGCFGSETKDILHHADFINRAGDIITLQNSDLQFSYRHAAVPTDFICINAYFTAMTGDENAIREKMLKLKEEKAKNQPLRGRTGGSTFKNPLPHHAWELIDAVGLRGHRLGGAVFSEKHCNFLLNDNNATARDIETLGDLAVQKVRQKFNIDLQWEIKKIGEA